MLLSSDDLMGLTLLTHSPGWRPSVTSQWSFQEYILRERSSIHPLRWQEVDHQCHLDVSVEFRRGYFYRGSISGTNTWLPICQNFHWKLTWALVLTRLQSQSHWKIFRRPPSQNSQQHFLRLSFLKWEEARMKFGRQRTFCWLLCPLTSLRLSLSPSFLLLLSVSFVPRLSCPLFVFSPKQALIRQWWCRYILAEVMFAYLASLLHSLLCLSSSSLHLPFSLAAPSTLTGSLLLMNGFKVLTFCSPRSRFEVTFTFKDYKEELTQTRSYSSEWIGLIAAKSSTFTSREFPNTPKQRNPFLNAPWT